MPDLKVLLDQNIPKKVADWLRLHKEEWEVYHTSDVGLMKKSDSEVYKWAVARKAVIITFDEDFADQRSFSTRDHNGIVRLRIWPTTIEETQKALARLVSKVTEKEISESLIIIDNQKIRLRSKNKRAK